MGSGCSSGLCVWTPLREKVLRQAGGDRSEAGTERAKGTPFCSEAVQAGMNPGVSLDERPDSGQAEGPCPGRVLRCPPLGSEPVEALERLLGASGPSEARRTPVGVMELGKCALGAGREGAPLSPLPSAIAWVTEMPGQWLVGRLWGLHGGAPSSALNNSAPLSPQCAPRMLEPASTL